MYVYHCATYSTFDKGLSSHENPSAAFHENTSQQSINLRSLSVNVNLCKQGIRYQVSYLDWGAFSHGLFLQAPSKQRKEKSTNQCSTILTYCTCVCNSVLPLSRWGTESWLEDKKLEPCTSLDQPSLPQGACVCMSVCLYVCVSVYVYVVCMYVRTCV